MKKVLLTVLILGSVNVANAANANSNFTTSSTLQASCAVNMSDMDLGIINNDGTNVQLYKPMYVICTKGTFYTIKVNAGIGTFAQRNMKSANTDNTDKLLYNLYNAPNTLTPYGDGSAGTAVSNGAGSGGVVQHAIYAKMTKNQFVTPGAYSDTLTVSIEY